MKLHQRGTIYHLRLRVPIDLVDVFNRSEIHQSLRTSDGQRIGTETYLFEPEETALLWGVGKA